MAEQIKALETRLERINPAFVPRLPLLGPVLNLSIPDNEFYRAFDAKLRKSSLEALLVDCLRARAVEQPLLLVLEDCHWLDPLSHDLIEHARAGHRRPAGVDAAGLPPAGPGSGRRCRG